MKVKNIVIIGGSGFIGSHTADELSRQGHKVKLFDRSPSQWIRNDQEQVIGDILDRDLIGKVISGADIVYHFASIADISEAKERPYDTMQVNVMGVTIALEAAVKAKISRFVYASTMYVYSPYGSFYRASKQAAELILEAYSEKSGLEYTILRYGSLYGPRSQDWNGLKLFVRQAVLEKKLNLTGDGLEKREFIHVFDAARLSVDILTDEFINKAITVTGHQVLNLLELAAMIFEISGVEEDVRFLDKGRWGDRYNITPYRYTPKKAMKLTSEKFVDLGQGILDLVEEVYQDV
jgi:UDP-glucose 4-epimerase